MKLAFLAFDGCALWQVAALQTQMHANGWAVRTLTLGGETVMSDGGLRLRADAAIETTAPRDYSMVLLAGGHGNHLLLEENRILRFLRQFTAHGNLLAACGSGTLLLGAAGLLGGLHIAVDPEDQTRHPDSFSRSIVEDNGVRADGNVITARGHASSAFAAAVCHRLGIPQPFLHG